MRRNDKKALSNCAFSSVVCVVGLGVRVPWVESVLRHFPCLKVKSLVGWRKHKARVIAFVALVSSQPTHVGAEGRKPSAGEGAATSRDCLQMTKEESGSE